MERVSAPEPLLYAPAGGQTWQGWALFLAAPKRFMVDYFALLDEPRRPWLEPEQLKQKFLALSSVSHPDRVHLGSETERATAQSQYAQLNTAYQCLRAEKGRLAHLLELERGAKPQELQRMPADLMNLSLEVGQLCREAESMAAQQPAISSPLLKVRYFENCQSLTERLQLMLGRISRWREELLDDLRRVDVQWVSSGHPEAADRAALLERLELLYRLFGFLGRWSDQLRERITRLTF